jgi:hypothetical protein
MSAERPLTSPQPIPKPKPMPSPTAHRAVASFGEQNSWGHTSASSNHDAASMRRHILNKESR